MMRLLQHSSKRLFPRVVPTMQLRRPYSSLAVIALCYCPSAAFPNQQGSLSPRNAFTCSSTNAAFFHSASHQRRQSRHFSNSGGDDLGSQLTHLPRLYVDSPSLAQKALISLTPFQSNYLNVMRVTSIKRWGQWAGHVRIFNGRNGEWIAKMIVSEASATPNRRKRQNANTDNTILECVQQTMQQSPSQPSGEVHLHMGRLKKPRRKWVLEKATELGVASIDIIDTEFSAMTDVWEYDKHFTQVVEAAEQCERLTIPLLSIEPTAWSDLIQTIEETSSKSVGIDHHWLVCRERSPELTLPILSALRMIDEDAAGGRNSSVHILVGPEGGWSPVELKGLTELKLANKNVRFVSLGPLVLRAETAAISAVTATILSNDQRME